VSQLQKKLPQNQAFLFTTITKESCKILEGLKSEWVVKDFPWAHYAYAKHMDYVIQ